MSNELRASALRIAEAMTDAMARLDAEAYGAVYADDATVWHNTDRLTQTKAENMAMLAAIMQSFSSLCYTAIRRAFTDDGFVQQHVLVGTLADGRRLEIPACLVVTIAQGRVSHIDEYLDPAPGTALMDGPG